MLVDSLESFGSVPSVRDAKRARADPPLSVTYRLLVSVEGGMHRGATFVGQSSRGILLGQSPACDVVLIDAGVHDNAVRLFEHGGRLAAEVMSSSVLCDQQPLLLGVRLFDAACIELQVGGALVKVELLRRSRRETERAPFGLPRAALTRATHRRWATIAGSGVLVVAAMAVVGGAVNASSGRASHSAAQTLESVIEPFNARGAQIEIVSDGLAVPELRGFVTAAQMREAVEHDLRAARLQARTRLHDVQLMTDSLTRLARLTGHECEARHLGGGSFDCQAGVVDAAALARLHSLVDQVPGAVSLEVHARQPEPRFEPVVAVAPEPALEPSKTEPARVVRPPLPVIRHVALGQHQSFAYDVNGRRLRVGDTVDGAKVVRVRFESVDLMLDGKRYSVQVTPVLSSSVVTTDD